MIKCTRKIEFDAAHRVIGHLGKCKFVHGHRYALEISFVANELDHLGMVVDFGMIKSIAKAWIDEHLDHTIILQDIDRQMGNAIEDFTGQKVYYMKNNPTAENIALHLKNNVFPTLFSKQKVDIVSLKLMETPNCYVEV